MFGVVSVNKAKAIADLKAVETAGRTTGGKLGTIFTKVGKVAKLAFAAVAIAAGAIFIASIKSAAEFEQAMAAVQAVTGATSEEFEDLTEKTEELGRETKFTMTEIASGMEALGRAGFATNEIIAGMNGVTALASATMTDLGEAARITATTIRQFGLDASEADRVANLFAATAASSNTTVQSLAESFKYFGPVAKTFDISLESSAAFIGKLGDAGIEGTMATRTLATSLMKLAAPTQEASDVMEELGLTFFDANGEFIGLNEMVRQLEDGFKDLNPQQKMAAQSALFGAQSVKQWNTILEVGADDLDAYTESITGTNAAFEQQEIQLNTLSGQWTILKGSISLLLQTLGERMLPVLKKLLKDTIIPMINRWSEWAKKTDVLDKAMKKVQKAFEWIETHGPLIAKGFKAIGVALVVLVAVKIALWANSAVAAFTSLAAVVGISSPLALGIIAITALLGGLVYKLNEAEGDAATLAEGSATAFEEMATAAEWELETVGDALTANQQLQLETMSNVTRWMHENQEDRTQLTKEELDKRARMEVESAHELERMQKEAASSSVGTAESTARKMFDIGKGIAQTSQDVLAQVRAAMAKTGVASVNLEKQFADSYEKVEETLTKWGINVQNVMTKMADYIGGALRSQITSRENYETRMDEISGERNAKEEEIVAAYDKRIDEIIKMYENDEITYAEMQALKGEALSDFLDAQTLANQVQADQQTEAERRREEERISFKEMLWQMASDFLSYIKEKLLIEAAWHAIEAAAWAFVPPLFIANPGAIGHAAAAVAMFAGAAGLAFAGFAEGGMVSEPTVGMLGEGAYSEAVLPLSPDVFGKIGQGIMNALTPATPALAAAGSIQVDMRGLYDGAVINVRSDQDIEQIARETYTLYKDRLRGIGRHV